MRITGGTLCGRTVKCPEGIIRPAMDRMRESVFSILGDLSGKSFLDLFAGSGVISLEAVSRGASEVVLIEKDRGKMDTVFENVSISPTPIQCRCMAAELFIKRNKQEFDYIFCDPPFPYKFHEQLVEKCSQCNTLADCGVLLIHRPKEHHMSEKIDSYARFDQRIYGRSVVDFYRKSV